MGNKLDWSKAKRPIPTLLQDNKWLKHSADLLLASSPKRKKRKTRKARPAIPIGLDIPNGQRSNKSCMLCEGSGDVVILTVGRKTDGTLNVKHYCSAGCSAQAGYAWAGR